ncbi:hypothetical protein [Bradyrhizobium glycinis]|uniref:hypothetical protein n=1 Tax=Bradyrhizobium glycinis TaxID=2751812 RepID=UPI0018D9878F|nr:hypothetical protein [Bradyrhizobium glycinis]MBH5368313.1 hypothetical protein [Bradyrhizobium glycinis]
MVAAVVLDVGLTISQLKHRAFRRAMFSKNRTDFSAFSTGATLPSPCASARLAYLLEISAEIISLLPKNNLTLTMFPQKSFTWSG